MAADPNPEQDPKRYLDPRVLDSIRRLDLRSRLVVEGYVSGMHDSPYRGSSVEFRQHREYVPGDDIRHVDWKVFAKSDRLYIKEFEEETNLKAHLFLDQSESMAYGSERQKFDYAATMAASLTYLIHQQRDSIGLNLFNEGLLSQLAPSNSRSQLNSILHALSDAAPTGKTRIGAILHEMADRIARKGLIILISDLFDKPDSILSGLRHLQHRGHDILLFHVFDRDEVDFPFERMTLFKGMEMLPELLVDPKSLREAYLKEVRSFEDTMRKGCQAQKIDYQLVVTDQMLDIVLTTYLAKRASLMKGGRRH
ncbi:MAG: DUF58 domain-containing protein [Planctomycetota bacterium]